MDFVQYRPLGGDTININHVRNPVSSFTPNEKKQKQERYPLGSLDKRLPPLNPAFKLAATHGVFASIRLHINRNDSLDARDEAGQTPLMIAAKKNRAEACRLLLDAGADDSLVDLNGCTALDLAVAAGANEALTVFTLHGSRSQLLSAVVGPDPLPVANNPTLVVPSPSPPHITTNVALEDSDEGSWTPIEEKPPPRDSPALRKLALEAQAKISAHQPKNTGAVQWDDVSGYLPTNVDILGIPDLVEKGLREIVLMGIREGEVRSAHFNDLLTQVDTSTPDNLFRLIVQMLNDLGVEVDDTFGTSEEWGSSRPFILPDATDAEAELQDESLQYLKGLLQGRNEPSRIFAKEAYVHPLLSQESEVQLAQLMEQSVEAAIEYLSEWPSGLRSLLICCDELKRGVRSLRSMQSSVTSEVGESESYESFDLTLAPPPHKHDAKEDEETSVETEESSGPDHIKGFILLADALQQLLNSSNDGSPEVVRKTQQILLQMRLAGLFLCSLSDTTDMAPAARGFAISIDNFLKARDQLVLSNLKLVVQLAQRYTKSGIDYLDLLQEGHIGLIRAVDKFDWRRGFKFSTMAMWWIRQQVQRAAPELGFHIRLPAHAVEKSWLMKRHWREFEDEHGHAPTTAWLAHQVGMPVRKVEPILRCISEPIPLDELSTHDFHSATVGTDHFDAMPNTEIKVLAEALLHALGSESRMAEKVLRMRYGVGINFELSPEDIAKRYGLSRERIRQIERQALKLASIHLGLRSTETGGKADENKPSKSGCNPNKRSKLEKMPVTPESPTVSAKSISTLGQQGPNYGQSGSDSSSTLSQIELLKKAKAMGLEVLTYKIQGGYETLVMLTPKKLAVMQEIEADLIDAGFQYKLGQGYVI